MEGTPPVDISSHLIQRMLGLPPPATRDLVIERDLRAPMADGAVLLADRWAPRAGGEALPTALLRTPYGRRGPFGVGMARPLAERGFQVMMQSTVARSAPAGLRPDAERARGRPRHIAVDRWSSPGSTGRSSSYGASYLGFAQWAMADDLPPEVSEVMIRR